MDFELSEEQLALRDAARGLLAQRWSSDAMRAAVDQPPASIPSELWSELAALGWVGIAISEDAGGSGADIMTAAVLAEETGRALLPGPFLSCVASAAALDRSDSEQLRKSLLPDLVSGASRVTLAIESPGLTWGPSGSSVLAARQGGEWVLDGITAFVPDAEAADTLLIAARNPDAGTVRLFAAPADTSGITVTPMRRLDGQSVSEVRLSGVHLSTDAPVGEGEDGVRVLNEIYDIWTVLLAADLLGTMQRALEITVAYAKERVQFDRPIGSFQAVSHPLANVLMDAEIGRSLLYGACLALDEGRDDAAALVSAAKAWTSDAAVRATETAIQLHGGIGYTWELDLHLYLRRARCNAVTLGDADHHRDRLAGYLERSLGG